MCVNLKTFHESFRDWDEKGEEGQFWWLLGHEENEEKLLVPTEAISGTTVTTDLHDHRANP